MAVSQYFFIFTTNGARDSGHSRNSFTRAGNDITEIAVDVGRASVALHFDGDDFAGFREFTDPLSPIVRNRHELFSWLRFSRSFAFQLGMPDEVDHERRGHGRVRLEQEVAGVENVGFHSR